MRQGSGLIVVALLLVASIVARADAAPRVCPGERDHDRLSDWCGWWQPLILRHELGVFTSRIPVEPGHELGGEGAAVTWARPGVVKARGASLRSMVSPWRRLYFGVEFGLMSVQSAPSVRHPAVATSSIRPMATPEALAEITRGFGFTSGIITGTQVTRGPLLLGAETALGFHALSLRAPDYGLTADDSRLAVIRPLLEVRARVGVWLTPFVSVSAQVGRDVLNHDLTGTVVLGLSVFPWDGLR